MESAPSSPPLLREVSATYTDDGLNWQRKQLLLNPATGRYEATLSVPAAGADVSAFFESLDNAGNVAVETHKGTLAGIEYIFLPVLGKQGAAVAQRKRSNGSSPKTRAELYQEAKRKDLPGRSKMGRAELAKALGHH